MIKTIYIHPGDMLDIRIVRDIDIPANATEWKYQTRPERILLQYKEHQTIEYSDPALRINLVRVGK